ncbi:hypothetical protein [Halapricum salinum]|uniref:hypothetical protein n=1 Tax=Halapricum salinum TaxID=1457250 RepID=UPI0010A481CF|nr:hypothetical protein [Halapricum salinum]
MSVETPVSGADESWTRPRLASGVGTVGVIIGAFLPWISVSFIATRTVNGIDADGVITLLVALVVGAAVVWKWSRATQVLSAIGGLITGGLGLMYITDPLAGVEFSSTAEEAFAEQVASPEIGLYVTALGGALLLIGGILGVLSE